MRSMLIGLAALVLAGSVLLLSATATSPPKPAEVLDLIPWKLDIPVNEHGHPTGVSEQIYNPELQTYSAEWFAVNDADPDAQLVVFRTPIEAATTSGSEYPRTELREMTDGGAEEASWSTDGPESSMKVRLSVDHLPPIKPEMNVAQIHDEDSAMTAIIAVGLDNGKAYKLCASWFGKKEDDCFAPSVNYGKRVTLQITAENGEVSISYEGNRVRSKEIHEPACYFKTGAYLLSNLEKGESADEYGQVSMLYVDLTHR